MIRCSNIGRHGVGRGLCLFTAAVVVAATFAGLAAGSRADGDSPLRIHAMFVDADDPSAWPKGLEPISAAELQRLLGLRGGQGAKPPASQIELATYRATFRDGHLIDGKGRFVIARCGSSASLVPLGNPSLELVHPRWTAGDESPNTTSKSENALWGTDSTGRRVLIAEPGKSRLTCEWSVSGRSQLGATEFAIALPPSVVSEMFLSVPDEWAVTCNAGVVSAATKHSQPGETLWQIELGSQSSCRLRVERNLDPTTKPALFVDQDTAYVVSAEKLQVQSKLQFDVYRAPLNSFALTVPAALRVETISYADIPLTFKSHASKDGQEIDVALPEPLVGKGRAIVVEASSVSHMDQMWRLPRIDVAGAERRDGQVELTIANPLKLLQFGGDTATAQLEAPSYGADGEETFKLRDADHQRPLLIKVGEPPPAVTTSILERLDLERDQCVLRCDVVCTATGGSTFSVECELPDVWDVTNVQAVGDVSRIIHWASREGAGPGRKRRIKVDFFRAVTEREPQRFRLEAARRVPRTGETMNLPLLSFPTLRSGELQTVVTHSPAIDLALDPPSEFVPLAQASISAPFANSPLLPDARQTGDERTVVHRKTVANEKARITLRRGEQGFVARVQSTIDIEASQINERIAATITPQTRPLDRLFVYLTSEGPPLTWLLTSDRPRPLDASLVDSSRHSEWNLPLGGELWEIRLPDPQRRSFRLEGTRKPNSVSPGGIGLAFLPGARSFSGTVEVRFESSPQFVVEAFGPRPVRPSDERLPVDARGGNRVIRMWSYERPIDSLVLKPRPTGSRQAVAQIAALDLHSYIYAGGTGDDLHTAIFDLAPLAGTRPFRFSLDSAARLTSVAVNGRVVRVQHHDDAVTVPSLPAEQWNRVEVLYMTSSTVHRFREKRPVVVPRADDAEIFQFRWWFALPPGILPCGAPAGTELTEKLPALSWSEKLFGPLGRPTGESKPPSIADAPWMADFGFESSTRPDVFAEIDPDRPDATWTVWRASADTAPRELAVAVWHESEMRQSAWIVFFGILSIGLVLQRFKFQSRKPLAVGIVAASATLSFAVPDFYSLPLGACVSGTLLSILVWGPVFARPAITPAVKRDRSRPESTVTFEYRAMLLLLIALGAIGVANAKGSEPTSIAPALDSPPSLSRADALSDLLVVVPTRGGITASLKQLPDDERLVYVRQGSLEILRRIRSREQKPDGYVFLSSQYAVDFDLRQPPTVDARFRVALISPEETTIRLPLSKVTLAGANACRVNGRPHPVRKTDDAFLLTLGRTESAADDTDTRPPIEHDRTRQPVEAVRPRPKGATSVASGPPERTAQNVPVLPRPRIFDITLSFFPETSGSATPAGFEFSMPKVASALVEVLKPGPAAPMTVETDDGQVRTLAAGAVSIAQIGETAWVRIAPGSVRKPILPALEGRAVQFVRLSPELIEMDCRVSYAANQNALDGLEWTIPAAAVARASDDGFRIARGTPSADGHWAPLKFALLNKPNGPLTLGIRLMIPARAVPVLGRPPHFMIPLVRFSGTSSAGVKLLSNQVGVTAIPGYRAAVWTNEPNLSHTSSADPAFRQEWRGGGRKEPEFILDSRGLSALPVELVPLTPSHKVRISHEGKLTADRLTWKTTAEIRVESAPAFVHRLRVDPRLKIDSISIQEDDVERLVRYSRSGQDVTLFLRDRAAATQDLVVSGSMPLELGHETKLPTVNLVGATITDARLLLEPGPQVDLAVIDAPPPATALRDEHDEQRALRRTREYLLIPDAPLPSVRVTQRAELPQVASVTVLTPDSSKAINVGVYLRLAGARSDEGPFEITIPQELAQRSTIIANVDKQVRPHADGSLGILLEARPAVEPIVQIRWSQTPDRETWQLPSLTVTNAAPTESLLLVADSVAWRPDRDSRVALQVAVVPEWMRRQLPDGQIFNSWTSAERNAAIWILIRSADAPVRKAPARVYANVALAADGSTLGSLFLLVEQQSGPVLSVRWPAAAVLRAALLDGKPVQPVSEKNGQLAFALGPERRVHRLAIHWFRTNGPPLGPVAMVSEEIPTPIDLDSKTILLAISVPPQFRPLAPASVEPLGPNLFADETKTIVTVGEPTAGVEAIGPEPAPTFTSGTSNVLLGRLAVDPNFTAIRFRVFRTSFVTIPLALATFVLTIAVLLWFATSKPAAWLASRQPLALAIVGTIWWLCLSPRVIGIGLLVAALVWLASRRRYAKPRGHDNLPSTVHLPA
jgi:hypothetical protein